MEMILRWALAGVICFGISACSAADRDTYTWVDWSEAGPGGAAGSAGGIEVSYSGDLNENSTPDGAAEDLFSPWEDTFTHDDLPEPPIGGDILRMYGGEDTGLQSLTFSPPARDPVIAVMSLGSVSEPARIIFDNEIEVLTSGAGKWGGGPDNLRVGEDVMTLIGQEAYGLVRVTGTFERLSFDIPDYESDYGLQIAVRRSVE